jgi:hypothetical protein
MEMLRFAMVIVHDSYAKLQPYEAVDDLELRALVIMVRSDALRFAPAAAASAPFG